MGPSIQRLFDSLTFVLLLKPYDVGDNVQISGIAANATHRVTQINVLTTEFESCATSKRLVARNSDIIGMSISNLRNSSNATFTPSFVVDHTISGDVFSALISRVKACKYAKQQHPHPTPAHPPTHS